MAGSCVKMDNKVIQSKLEKYARSSSGKAMMQQLIEQRAKDGKRLASGNIVAGEKELRRMADDLVHMIKKRMPKAIENVGDTLAAGHPVKLQSGETSITLSFDESKLRRESLENNSEYWRDRFDGHTGEGIDNIVGLINTGYGEDKIGKVYGLWASHGERIRNRLSWEGEWFIQAAVKEFNRKYQDKYDVAVIIGDDYTDKAYRG